MFIAGLFVLAASELAEHRRAIAATHAEASRCRSAAAAMVAAVDAHGWDGAWFRRAYDFFGAPVGSAENDEGQIFVEPQGICVMAGVGLADGRARTGARLGPERGSRRRTGSCSSSPPTRAISCELGEISSYPPGYKENAGDLLPHEPVADDRARRSSATASGALDYYLRINPSAREAISDVHRCEPYVYAQMIAGPRRADPRRGEELVADRDRGVELGRDHAMDPRASAPSTTACGSSPRPARGLAGLSGDPAVPRRDYEIEVRRDGARHRCACVVDGGPVAGSLVPLPPRGTRRVRVEVRLS